MAKEFFKDLPDTTTPLTATRLNGLLDGEEVIGNIVVDSIKTKNMFDNSNFAQGGVDGNAITNRVSTRQVLWLKAGTYTFSTNMPSTYRYGILIRPSAPPTSSTSSYDSGWLTNTSTHTFTITTAGYYMMNFSKPDNSDLTISDISSYNFQLEEGSTATTYTPYQNLDGQEIYSTGEVKIGTWIDGKPLYRKTVTINSINTSNNYIDVSHGISNMSMPISVNGTAKITNVNQYRPFGCMFINTSGNLDPQYVFSVYGVTESAFTLCYGNWWKTRFDRAYITIEYTKTTD